MPRDDLEKAPGEVRWEGGGDLRSLSRAGLFAVAAGLREPPYRARQLFGWIHRRLATSIEAMTDLPAQMRRTLAARATLAPLAVDATRESSDGTIKYLLRAPDGARLEAVFLPEEDRRTLCVSTQVGCAMGCTFCRTGTMGLSRDLSAGEIVDQVYRVETDLRARGHPGDRETGRVLTNLVFMGMGEPLHNLEALIAALDLLLDPAGLGFSHRHITVSTSGLVPEMAEFARRTRVKLAVSLNAPTDEQRERIMPVDRKYPLARLIAACRDFPTTPGRELTFEYVLLSGVNDADEDAQALASLAGPLGIKVNLIPYNENPGLGFGAPDPTRVQAFHEILVRRGVLAMVRKNRGRDVAAACGQLAAQS